MSAQAYTNRRRILAEASVLKVQYPVRVAVTNTLVPTINCNQNFQPIQYNEVCMCVFNGYGNNFKVRGP